MSNPLADNDIYCRNLAALFRSDSSLAQRIDECEPDSSVIVEPAKRGGATVALKSNGSDRPVYIHSKVAPLDEAKRWADAVEISDNYCYIVGGAGLGHHVLALHERLTGDAILIITESNLHLLRAAMETVDLTDLIKPSRCIFLTHADKSDIQGKLEPHNTLMMMGAQFVSHAPSDRIAGEFQASMRKLLADHMAYCKMCLVTLVANSRKTCTNIANNLPRYLATPPIDVLKDRFKGYPGIVVSAGPSLRKNIDQLKPLNDKAVICTVQTTFKTLLNHGVTPHFVTSLDYHEMSKRFFEGLDHVDQTHLVAEPKAHCAVLDSYRGPVSLLDNDFARLCLGDALAGRAGLKAGATVAHLCLYTLVHMGCDPIILIGQDLGYTNHVYYSPGVALHDLWRPDLNRFSTMEMKEWERIARFRKILIRAKDVHGRDIYTDEQLFTYLQQFEGDFAALPGRVIDATEGGVRKAGTTVMTLADATRQYCTKPIPKERFAYLQEQEWNNLARLEAGKAELDTRLREADEMVTICDRLVELLSELQGLLKDPPRFNQRLAEVDALRVKIRASERIYRIVSSLSQHAELQRYSADRRIGKAELKSIDLARSQLERDVRFVEAMGEGAKALREILEGSIERFDEALARGYA